MNDRAIPSLRRTIAREGAHTGADARTQADLQALERWALVPIFALLTSLGAMVSIPIPPYGIPQTLQTLAVLLCALALGPRLGTLSMLVYLGAGVVGVPMFADGKTGWITVLGQTGGYLVGFALCQPVAHAIVRRRDRSLRGWGSVVVAGVAVHAVIFAVGVPWLYCVRRFDPDTPAITAWQAVYHGCVVFLPGMLLKTAVATLLAMVFRPEMARRVW